MSQCQKRPSKAVNETYYPPMVWIGYEVIYKYDIYHMNTSIVIDGWIVFFFLIYIYKYDIYHMNTSIVIDGWIVFFF
jgi:hypothetical protein